MGISEIRHPSETDYLDPWDLPSSGPAVFIPVAEQLRRMAGKAPRGITEVPGYIDRFTLVVSPRIVARTATSKMRSEQRRRRRGWAK